MQDVGGTSQRDSLPEGEGYEAKEGVISCSEKTFALALFSYFGGVLRLRGPVILKLSSSPDGNPTTDSMVFFAEKVKEKTGGTVEVRLFNNSALGGQREALESLQAGTIEMCMANAGPMGQFVPTMDVLSLPYVFQSTDHMFKALNGKAGEMLKADIDKAGFVFLYWGDGGSRNLINNKRPITKPEDLKGLKIRVMDSKLMVNTLNAMGAIATPMAQGEVYSALQQGVLDGWENNPVTLLTLKLYEVSDIFSWTRHFMVPDLVIISKQAFAKLTPEQQKAMLEAGREAEGKQREYWNAFVGKTVEDLKAHNVKFNEVDVAPFVKAVQPVWEEYRAKFGTELLDLIIAANNRMSGREGFPGSPFLKIRGFSKTAFARSGAPGHIIQRTREGGGEPREKCQDCCPGADRDFRGQDATSHERRGSRQGKSGGNLRIRSSYLQGRAPGRGTAPDPWPRTGGRGGICGKRRHGFFKGGPGDHRPRSLLRRVRFLQAGIRQPLQHRQMPGSPGGRRVLRLHSRSRTEALSPSHGIVMGKGVPCRAVLHRGRSPRQERGAEG